MNENKTDPLNEIYLGSTQIEETIRMIEEDGWNEGEMLFQDLKDLRMAMGQGRDTKSQYEYVRDFLTYLINKNDYWKQN